MALIDALSEISSFLGQDSVVTEARVLERQTSNTLGLERRVEAVVKPRTTADVQNIVRIANRYRVTLYPFSRGRNIGYGEKAPPRNVAFLVDLSGLNAIRSYDHTLGTVVIEPGVTQGDLSAYLSNQGDKWITDVTGAGTKSSIVGNTLEGGFGHTPLGNRRKNVAGLEVVLGTGDLFYPGKFPGIGPDLNGIFVQSNFGIVTAASLRLYRRPECYNSFRLTVPKEEDLVELVETLRDLRQRSITNSLVHIADPMRMVVTTGRVPPGYETRRLGPYEASEMLSAQFNERLYWTAVGGLYGTSEEVSIKRRILAESIRRIGGHAMFFSDERIDFMERVGSIFARLHASSILEHMACRSPILEDYLRSLVGYLRTAEGLQRTMRTYRSIHNLMNGVPSDMPEENILWRNGNHEDNGLIWISPTFPSLGETAKKVYDLGQKIFRRYDFEMPLTITLVEPDQCVGIISLHFNKNDPEERERAYQLYHEVLDTFSRNGIFTYRSSILEMDPSNFQNPERWDTFERIKVALDPNRVISPGRYGI
ncbi:FAD-binding oxidoreductase [Candidatus Woesearchaeota archaeon]|nr:FAD-binding oxidoreductase [Candidatus Woesearchaeota archaeon]